MAIAELLHALEIEATAEVAAIGARAQADAAALVAAAARRRAEHHQAVLDDDRAARQVAADAAIADAGRQGRRDVLTARAAALDRLRAAVIAGLPGLVDGAEGGPILDRLVAALVAATGDVAIVRCQPALVAAVRARVAAHPGLQVEADPTVAVGVVAERAGGRVTIDATLASLLARLWPRLRLEARPAEAVAP